MRHSRYHALDVDIAECMSRYGLIASLDVQRLPVFTVPPAVSVNLLYGFGQFNLQNPGYPLAHFPWCEPCISHRVVRYQPHAIATMAGGFYAHGGAPLAAARSFSPGHRCVPAGFSPL